MTGACFDSVILIDILNGRPEAGPLMKSIRPQHRFISIVTRTELLTGTCSDFEWAQAGHLLDRFVQIDVTAAIADAAARLRQQHRLKTPDAIIAATAAAQSVPLFTRDTALAALPGVVLAYA
mgnify:CR=1 FL=1